ncbi:MAG: AAA family ATPase [Methylococcaceae bacterium]
MLKSLVIKNFRTLADFEVAKLGRVNLIVGKNNSGKSSVLEALRIYAGNGQRVLLETISAQHGEKVRFRKDVQTEDASVPFQDFFTGREFPTDSEKAIQIGSFEDGKNILRIEHAFISESEETITNATGEISTRFRRQVLSKPELQEFLGEVTQALIITKGGKSYPPFLLDSLDSRSKFPINPIMFANVISCSVIPTQFVSPDELADEWDKIVLTEYEDVVKQAMRIIAPEFENLTFVRNEDAPNRFRRSAIVKMLNIPKPVPLNSLGDGVLRILQLALKIFSAKGGFFLIDEFENGLHYSVQEKIWALLFEMAEKLDIQVFATTHSWDCIESFSKVAIDRKDIDGVLFRVGKSVRDSDRGRVIATVFDEEALYSITQSDVEVR